MSNYFAQLIGGTRTTVAHETAAADTVADSRGESSTPSRRDYELAFLARSGLFDADFYLAQYPDIAAAGAVPLEHFYETGHSEGRRPNYYFDPQWYLSQNPDVRDAGIHPLVHYASYGDLEGRRPSLFFDTVWYRKNAGLTDTDPALRHYLENCKTSRVSPLSDFDVGHYSSSYPDVTAAGIDPFVHFVTYGYLEGRTPSAHFDAKFYWARYLKGDRSQNPFIHFLMHKHEPGVFGRMPDDEASIPREVKRFTRPASEFEEFAPLPPSAIRRAKLLTYYLPQFHAFPENDVWWGKGFTEWANVPRGLPRFKGHYQPRIPRDLGFYSLSHTDAMRRQVEMAQAGGVYGFVFYHYWFNGKRLLEKPTDAFLADPSIKMPFCLMWANENWTRRWDGADAEVLISQDYRPEDEAGLLADFNRHFKDSRYIRVQGRPLLMIYRPGLITDAKKTIARWRSVFKKTYNEDPLLVMGQTFNAVDPTEFGIDGAIEFPPHKLTQHMQPVNETLQYLDIEFEGKAYRYDDVVDVSLKEPKASFPLIKTAVPSWDNDARRQGNGLALIDSTPQKYQTWLGELVDRAVKDPFFGEPLICVNAWNEWCEGAYLEPDLHFGAAYLNATARAVCGKARTNSDGRVLLVGHDCFPSGAQHLLRTIGETLKGHFGVEVSFLVLEGGKLEAAYKEIGPVKIVSASPAMDAHLISLRESGFGVAIVNTSAAATAVPALKKAGFDVTMLVHELPRILREKNLVANAKIAVTLADRVVFPAPFVRDQYCAGIDLDRESGLIIAPQGMYQKIEVSQRLRDERRKEFGVGKQQRFLIGMGYADLRKGFDLFLQTWRLVRKAGAPVVHFCWVGDMDPALKNMMRDEIADAEATGTFHMAGYRKDVSSFLSAADGFVLSSREDPFPSVVLEALSAGLPVFAFDRAGGIPDVLREVALGHVVPFGDTVALASAMQAVMKRGPDLAAREAGRQLIEKSFDFPAYVWNLLKLSRPDLPEISIVVPNYNYAKHMSKRLGSIFAQSQPVKEVLVLDDCSTDNSLLVIPAVAEEWHRQIKLIPNLVNSGSVFKQWRKAAEQSTGEFLWIAEADDLSSPKFLCEMLALLRHDPSVAFAFSDSCAIDAQDALMWPSYKEYYSSVLPGALQRTEVFEAADFVARFLSTKNLILNVSAVVWRRDALVAAMKACESGLSTYKMAGDWRLYLQALATKGTRVGYCAEALNTHRRHAGSVTHALDAARHVAEIESCHAFSKAEFTLSPALHQAQQTYRAEVSLQLGGEVAANPTSPGVGKVVANTAAKGQTRPKMAP